MRLVIAITGASGVTYGIRILEVLKRLKIDTHLIITEWGAKNIKIETDSTVTMLSHSQLGLMKTTIWPYLFQSGSFKVDGMIVIPCSTKTLASIANALDDSLVQEPAGVCIKEQRKLVLVPRETPLSKIHLENMAKLAKYPERNSACYARILSQAKDNG